MYTANIVDTVVFRALGKHPNQHLETLENAVAEAGTELWVPAVVYEELAATGTAGDPVNPYLDAGIEAGWIRVARPMPGNRDADEGSDDPAVRARHEADAFLTQHSKYPTTNNWRDAAMVALAVFLFEANERIRVITHTADELLAAACTSIPPEFGYYDIISRYYNPPQSAKQTFPMVASLTWDGP